MGKQDFPRLRIGIGDYFEDAVEYVLSLFIETEQKYLPSIIQTAGDAILFFVHDGIKLAMSRLNRNHIET